jgi:hypothetical protein
MCENDYSEWNVMAMDEIYQIVRSLSNIEKQPRIVAPNCNRSRLQKE